jgi:hypothetical protein
MANLGELFDKYRSDKNRNQYTALYHSLFKNIRSKPLLILEIGVGCTYLMGGEWYKGYQGSSLKAWSEYFPRASLYGIDIAADAIDLNFFNGRVTTHLCNSTDVTQVNAFAEMIRAKHNIPISQVGTFDIIIDDGSHLETDQLATLRNVFPHLKANGYYVLEDIGGDMRNIGYSSCVNFHQPRPIIKEITNNAYCYVVDDWTALHGSAIMVIST